MPKLDAFLWLTVKCDMLTPEHLIGFGIRVYYIKLNAWV